MSDTAAAKFVRYVTPDEMYEPDHPLPELVKDAKSRTYEFACEHAVLEIDDGSLVMVRGGQFGIDLEVRRMTGNAGTNRDELVVNIDQRPVVVRRLVFHTHPRPTGPSDGDFAVLDLLGQASSLLIELGGPQGGTEFKRKQREVRRE